jgi:NAD(P)H dehydrogenase (quinone)
MIIVTGANGQLGRLVVGQLLDRVPAGQIGLSVRDPQKASGLAARGVRVRRGDFADPASLASAFEDATKVLVVSVDRTGETAVRQHRTAIEAAAAAGAKRILYTSHIGANPQSPCPPMPDHAATEEILRGCGVPFTSLRNGFYATTVPMLLRAALATGELAVPEDGPVAWTALADLAEAAAIALTQDGVFDGLTPPLTGPSAIDMAGAAAIAADLTGRPIRRVVVCDADYRAGLVAHGLPPVQADMLVSLFTASRRGDFGPADPALAGLIGRPATPLADVLTATMG